MPPVTGLLRDADFRKLWASVLITAAGHQVSRLVLPLAAVTLLEAGEFEIGVLTALTEVALLVIGLPAGAWIDQVRRRKVLITADMVRGLVLVTVPAAWWLGLLTIEHLFAVAFLVGACGAFYEGAAQSYLPSLVGRAGLVEANAKLEGIRQVFGVAGPVGGGQLAAVLGAPMSLLATVGGVVASSALVARIRKSEPRVQGADFTVRGMRRSIAEGLRFVLGNRLMRAMAFGTAWLNLCVMAYTTMTVVFLARTLGLDAEAVGVVLAGGGVGGLLGALTARRLAEVFGQGPTMWGVLLIGMPFYGVLPLVESDWRIWLGAAAGAAPTYAVIVYSVVHISVRQAMTPGPMLGRMNTTMRFLNRCAVPLGSLAGGALGTWLGPRSALLIAAAGASLAFLPLLLSPVRTMQGLPIAEVAASARPVLTASAPPNA